MFLNLNDIESVRKSLESSRLEVAEMHNSKVYPSGIYCRIDPFDVTDEANKERRRIERSYKRTMELQVEQMSDRLISMLEKETERKHGEHVLTSEELLTDWDRDCPTYPEHWTERGVFKYLLTEGEYGWLKFIGGRYAIANVINGSSIATDDGLLWQVDTYEVSKALHDDAVDRAPMLDEDTALAKLIWFIGPDEAERDDA